jgi:hypothetical protein
LEEAGNEFGLSFHVVPFDPRYLPLSDHRHCLKSRHCSSRRLETAEAKPWPGQAGSVANFLALAGWG